jgi:hypothetical protein
MRGNIQWSGTTGKTTAGVRGLRPPAKDKDFPRPDPLLIPRDEAIFLLHTAAEIEHSLMVQYLYTAMTLNLGTEQDPDPDTPRWQRIILGIAKEEMGHFITVQNILRLIGGPLNFEREDTPFRSEYYPFPFSLRPLMIRAPERGEWKNAGTLNRYIAAEMPPLEHIRDRNDRAVVGEVLGCPDEKSLLDAHDAVSEVNQVGRLYARLIDIFSDKEQLPDEDFLAAEDIEGYMADGVTWDRAGEHFNVLVVPTHNRQQAVDALKAIAEQGEGEKPKTIEASHFQKFLKIYRELKARQQTTRGFDPALPVPWDPTPAQEPTKEEQRKQEEQEFAQKGVHRITDPAARLWAQLFDLRYRMTLGLIMHQMLLDAKYGPDSVMARRALANAAITEMHSLGWIARAIVSRPLRKPDDGKRAAPSFELPYTFAFPDREADRARVHLAVLGAVKLLVKEPRETDKKISKDEKELLHWLMLRDLTLERLCKEIATKKKKWCKCEEEEEEESEEETV